jgi:glutathione synthase/RimK-type ligase-like ATP-grasp enzyme
MKDLFVFPYKAGSRSAIAISDALNCFRINRDGSSRFARGSNKAVINWGWGDSLPLEVAACTVINKPEAVARAISKIESFKRFIEYRVNCPDFTQDRTTATQWAVQGHRVYCRSTSSGSDGSGLTVVSVPPGGTVNLPNARLYTKGLAIRNEYRVHVVGDEVITYQKKVPRSDVSNHNMDVRTTNGGWGFDVVEDERLVPSNIDDECILAIKALGLDFGGVDVVDNGGKAYVIEVNTAPHLTPYSSRKMAEALREYIG